MEELVEPLIELDDIFVMNFTVLTESMPFEAQWCNLLENCYCADVQSIEWLEKSEWGERE